MTMTTLFDESHLQTPSIDDGNMLVALTHTDRLLQDPVTRGNPCRLVIMKIGVRLNRLTLPMTVTASLTPVTVTLVLAEITMMYRIQGMVDGQVLTLTIDLVKTTGGNATIMLPRQPIQSLRHGHMTLRGQGVTTGLKKSHEVDLPLNEVSGMT